MLKKILRQLRHEKVLNLVHAGNKLLEQNLRISQ